MQIRTSDSTGAIAAALAAAQSVIPVVAMTGRNPHLRNAYATLNDIVAAIRRPLADNGLSFVQAPVYVEGVNSIGLVTRILHTSGEWVEASLAFPADGSGNRGVNAVQAAGGVITYMRRYMLAAMLGIVADEDVDGNSPEQAPQQQQQRQPEPPRQQAPPPPARPTAAPQTQRMTDRTRRQMHALGTQVYGAGAAGWDAKRADFARFYHVDSSNEFTEAQARDLIAGMQERQRKLQEDAQREAERDTPLERLEQSPMNDR